MKIVLELVGDLSSLLCLLLLSDFFCAHLVLQAMRVGGRYPRSEKSCCVSAKRPLTMDLLEYVKKLFVMRYFLFFIMLIFVFIAANCVCVWRPALG
jgi:hypothetical protein